MQWSSAAAALAAAAGMTRALPAQPAPVPPPPPPPAAQAPPAGAANPINVAERVRAGLEQDEQILLNPRKPQGERDDAAARLVQARRGDDARAVVRNAMRLPNNRGAQLAIARA